MGIQVEAVTSPAGLSRFIRFPLRLYADDGCFVPHLLSERRRFFSRRNPLFAFTEPCYFLARDAGGAVVGRVSAHVNRRHNKFWGERAGFFGFFECVEDLDVARALMTHAEQWLAGQGMGVIRGPFNFSTNEECGFLAEGFDTPPAVMMPYTKRYYLDFMAELGYAKARDLLAFYYECREGIPPFLTRVGKRAEERHGVVVRPLNMRRFAEDVRKAFDVYNRAWERNWGFVPMTEEQFAFAAHELKGIVVPELALIAEMDGEPVGFALALPDYNPLLKKMGGRLLPFGIVRFLLGRRSLDMVRVLTLGVVEEHRRRGIDALLVYYLFANGLPKGYWRGEFSWVLEGNVLLERLMERMGATAYKTYRIFEKPL
jgi:GNAT superfamily N-acetyltransferase